MRFAIVLACLVACAVAGPLRMPYQTEQAACDWYHPDKISVLTFSSKQMASYCSFIGTLTDDQIKFDAKKSPTALWNMPPLEYAFCIRSFTGWTCGGTLPPGVFFETVSVDCTDGPIDKAFYPASCRLKYTLGGEYRNNAPLRAIDKEATEDLALSKKWPESMDPRNYHFFKYVTNPAPFKEFFSSSPPTIRAVDKDMPKDNMWRDAPTSELYVSQPAGSPPVPAVNVAASASPRCMRFPEPADATPFEQMVYIFVNDECLMPSSAHVKAMLYSSVAVFCIFVTALLAGGEIVAVCSSAVFSVWMALGDEAAVFCVSACITIVYGGSCLLCVLRERSPDNVVCRCVDSFMAIYHAKVGLMRSWFFAPRNKPTPAEPVSPPPTDAFPPTDEKKSSPPPTEPTHVTDPRASSDDPPTCYSCRILDALESSRPGTSKGILFMYRTEGFELCNLCALDVHGARYRRRTGLEPDFTQRYPPGSLYKCNEDACNKAALQGRRYCTDHAHMITCTVCNHIDKAFAAPKGTLHFLPPGICADCMNAISSSERNVRETVSAHRPTPSEPVPSPLFQEEEQD